VLDDVVEGQRVNVRLAPDLESPVLAQLHTGDPVKGVVAPQNNKWLEMELPASARLYVAKEYIEVAGAPELYHEKQRRGQEVGELLNAAYLVSQAEMRKSYNDIDMKRIESAFEPIVARYPDFPAPVAKAKEALKQLQELYVQKKVTHLETKQLDGINVTRTQRKELETQVKSQQERLAVLESQVDQALTQAQAAAAQPLVKAEAPKAEPKPVVKAEPVKPKAEAVAAEKPKVEKIAAEVKADKVVAKVEKAKPADKSKAPVAAASPWTVAEEQLYQAWANGHEPATLEAFYMEESLNAVELAGTIEPYREQLRSRPGDFIIYDGYRPLGYLYSTQVDLASLIGKRVKVRLAPRQNHHFAFPAFFVLSAEPA